MKKRSKIFAINSRKKNTKNLKKLLKSITSPKGARQRDGNLQTNSPIEKGSELFDCDGESYRMTKLLPNLTESDDKIYNNKDEDAANTTGDNKKTQQTVTVTKTPPTSVILADLCEVSSDLKNSAMFFGSRGTLLSTV